MALLPALTHVFPGAKFHHPAVHALLQHYILPEGFVTAGAPTIAAILTENCQTTFGLSEAEHLVSLCCQTLTHPLQREVLHLRANQLTTDIPTAEQHKRQLPQDRLSFHRTVPGDPVAANRLQRRHQ